MSPSAEELIRDPVFQLNALLWMMQPLPEHATIDPLLYQRGFTVWAIAPPLAPPPELRLRAQQREMDTKDLVRPDVIAAKPKSGRFALVECKASSFGPLSSAASQARTLLVLGGPPCAEALGISDREVSETLCPFLMPEDQRDGFAPTLSQLHEELTAAELEPGRSSLLGLQASEAAIAVQPDEAASTFFGLPREASGFLTVEEDTSPRPLYFIPYDPDVDQSVTERQYGKRVLFERMLSAVISATGRATPPCPLVLHAKKLLNDAMFGMYEHWENRDASARMRRLCRELMNALRDAVESVVSDAFRYEPPVKWHVALADEEQREQALKALMRFSCEEMALAPPPQPELFDELEEQ
jgi:hypothetical protein